jgi:hypothetical protein
MAEIQSSRYLRVVAIKGEEVSTVLIVVDCDCNLSQKSLPGCGAGRERYAFHRHQR